MITKLEEYKKLLIKESLVNKNTETEKDIEKDVDKKTKPNPSKNPFKPGKKVSPKPKANLSLLLENMKQGKLYVQQNKIEQSVLDEIVSIDPSKTKKYVGWLCKMYIQNNYQISSLKSYVEEFDVFVQKNKSDTKDIGVFKTIDEFKSYVDVLNNIGTASLKEAESDYDVILDNEDLYIVSPNTHEASRKLGLTTFAHRGNGCDSAWCTTYKNDSHFKDYFYKQKVTFYYILIKNKQLIEQVGGDHYSKLAFAVYDNGKIDAYDANDDKINTSKLEQIRKIINV